MVEKQTTSWQYYVDCHYFIMIHVMSVTDYCEVFAFHYLTFLVSFISIILELSFTMYCWNHITKVLICCLRDDGWWQCENSDGVRGYVPSTFLKQHIKYKDLMVDDEQPTTPTTPRTGKALWGSIRQAVTEVCKYYSRIFQVLRLQTWLSCDTMLSSLLII